MLYSEFMSEAIDLTIAEDDYSGLFVLDPHYKVKMIDAGLTPGDVTDYPIDMQDVSEVLKLEVERLNATHSNSKYCVDFLAELISAVIQPGMIDQENELMKNMMDYMKLNSELKEKEASLEQKEKSIGNKADVAKIAPGMSFSKKKK